MDDGSGGMFAASVMIGSGMTLPMAGLTKFVTGRFDANAVFWPGYVR